MTVLVTGASGHVGANLVRALLARGRGVRALIYDDAPALEGLEVERVPGDVLDRDSLKPAFRGAEVVYHLAARVSIHRGDRKQVLAVNGEGTHNVVEACLDARVRRLVHFSTVHILEREPADEVIDESRPLVSADKGPAYDRSKARAQREVLAGVECGLDAVIVHPSAIIGPHDYEPSLLGDLLLALCRRRLPALVKAGYDWVDVRDVVAGALAAEERGRAGAQYILSGHWLSMRDLADLVAHVSGVRPPGWDSPVWLAWIGAPFSEWFGRLRKRRPLFTRESLRTVAGNSRFDNTRARRELGFDPRPMEETIADTLRWFAEAGWIDERSDRD